jgi:chromosome segregation ATPase
LQQMQLQERRLNRASAHLDDLRKQIAALSEQQAQVASELQRTEARLGQEGDPEHLRDLQQHQSDLKNMMERLATREAQLRPQEADAAMLVQNEQNKWQDLSDQLSTLIQGLGSEAAPAQKPQAP